jgi:hypothetical protein
MVLCVITALPESPRVPRGVAIVEPKLTWSMRVVPHNLVFSCVMCIVLVVVGMVPKGVWKVVVPLFLLALPPSLLYPLLL